MPGELIALAFASKGGNMWKDIFMLALAISLGLVAGNVISQYTGLTVSTQ